MGRPKKDLAAIARAAEQLSDSSKLAERLDRIASGMMDRLEKGIADIKPAQLPLGIAILIDKAAQARGSAIAMPHSSVTNIQINGLDKEGLRAALAGIGDMQQGKRKPPRNVSPNPDATMRASLTGEVVCPLPEVKQGHVSESSAPAPTGPEPVPELVPPAVNSQLLSGPVASVEPEHVANVSCDVVQTVHRTAETAPTAQSIGGEGGQAPGPGA